MTEELARRGAEVTAIDISPQLVEIAEKRIPEALHEQITFTSGDMLSTDLGTFDHVMAMDSMIYYTDDDLGQALAGLSERGVHVHRLHRGTAHAVSDGVLHGRKAVSPVRPFAHDDPSFAEEDRHENGSARRNRICFRGRACQPRLLHLHLPGVPCMSVLKRISIRYLPFADAASDELPLGQLLRLSLFQVSVGMAAVLLLGTLNRVMIVELQVSAFLVAAMVALPVLIAPFRALLGFKSDTYKSSIGWKRIPYLWFGTLWQFGGLAIMPASLLVLGGDVTQVRYDIPYAGKHWRALPS
jgi:hypothetical protein